MADKSYLLRLELEGGQVVARALEDVGVAGDRAMQRVGDAVKREATPGLRALGTATDEVGRKVDEFAGRLGPLGKVLTAFGPNGLYMAAAAGGFALLGRAIGGMVTTAIADLDQLGDAGDRLKVNVETLQALRLAAREAGFEMADADQAITKLREARLNALSGQRGSDRALQAFGAFGISEADLRQLDDVDALLQRISESAAQMGDKGQAAANLFKLGLDAVASALLGADDGLKGTVNRMKEAGLVIDDELVKRAGDVNAKWELMATKLNTEVTPALIHLAEAATPVLKALAETLSWIIDRMGDVKTFVEWFGTIDLNTGELSFGSSPKGTGTFVGNLPGETTPLSKPTLTFDTAGLQDGLDAWRDAQREADLLARKASAAAEAAQKLNDMIANRRDWRNDPTAAADRRSAMERASDTVSERDVRKALIDPLSQQFEERRQFVESFRGDFVAAFTSAMRSGDVVGVLQSLADAFAQRFYEGLANSLYDALIGGLGNGGGGGGGGLFGSIFNAVGSLFGGGGGGLKSAFGTSYAWADGGDFKSGQMGWVGERGPELVRWASPGTVIPANVSRSIAGGDRGPSSLTPVQVTVINNTGVQAEVSTQQTLGPGEVQKVIVMLNKTVDTRVKSAIRAGDFDGAMRDRYGARPRTEQGL